jgi:hypothetical protein
VIAAITGTNSSARAMAQRERARRSVAVLAAAVIAATVGACAGMNPPPGGPQRLVPPVLIGFYPETNSVNVVDRPVVFRFDEVVSERPRGVATLNLLFLVSPRNGEPHVYWERERIAIRPRGGYRPNTVYTVTMLPGLTDLYGNARRTGAVLTFSTGPTIPETTVRGRVFDWLLAKPAPHAFVQAIVKKDTSVVYVAIADSSGFFTFRHIPPDVYTIRGFIDANNNRALDRLELWDTTSINLVDTARAELLAFLHDTIGPGIGEIAIQDSVTLRVAFDRGIDSTQQFGPDLFTIKGRDSIALPITNVRSGPAYDSAIAAASRAKNDSILKADSLRRADSGVVGRDTTAARLRRLAAAARRDSIARARAVGPSRKSPIREVVVQLGAPLKPGEYYRLHAIDVHGLLGKARSSDRVVLMPKPQAADSARLRRQATPNAPAPKGGTPASPSGKPPSAVPMPGTPPPATTPAPQTPAPPPSAPQPSPASAALRAWWQGEAGERR